MAISAIQPPSDGHGLALANLGISKPGTQIHPQVIPTDHPVQRRRHVRIARAVVDFVLHQHIDQIDHLGTDVSSCRNAVRRQGVVAGIRA